MNRPASCRDFAWEYVPAPELAQAFSLGARYGLEPVANRLQDEIAALYREGRLARIAQQWHLISAQDATLTRWMFESQRRSDQLQWGLMVALTLAAAIGGLFVLARRARRAAEQSSEARSRFLANMSHEIRTPLNGILGMLELVLNTSLTAAQRDQLGVAKSAAENLLTILNDILDFSKIEAEKLELDATDFALEEAVAGAIRVFAPLAAQKGVLLEVRIDPRIPERVCGDPVRFRQVLANLVGNAVKFTERGAIRVDLELGGGEPPPGYIPVHVSVEDSGVGIPAEKQATIFEAFAQASHSMTRRAGGTGLGLAIARELVRLMGGQLQLESAVGVGSRFFFTARFRPARSCRAWMPRLDGVRLAVAGLAAEEEGQLRELLTPLGAQFVSLSADPLPHAVIVPEHAAELPAAVLSRRDAPRAVLRLGPAGISAGAEIFLARPFFRGALAEVVQQALGCVAPVIEAEPVAGPSLRVLAVEDNVINQKVVQRMLETAGHRVTLAPDGREALKLLLTKTFDVVLMDVQMPEMSGTRVTRAWRRYESRRGLPPVPIIGLTAMSMKGDRVECLRSGMNECLSKPIQRQRLLDTIAQWTGNPPVGVTGLALKPDMDSTAVPLRL